MCIRDRVSTEICFAQTVGLTRVSRFRRETQSSLPLTRLRLAHFPQAGAGPLHPRVQLQCLTHLANAEGLPMRSNPRLTISRETLALELPAANLIARSLLTRRPLRHRPALVAAARAAQCLLW